MAIMDELLKRAKENQERQKAKENPFSTGEKIHETKSWRDWKGAVNTTDLVTGQTKRTYYGPASERKVSKDSFGADIGQSVAGAIQRQEANYKSALGTVGRGIADLFNGKEEYKPKVGSWLWRVTEGAEADTGAANKLMEDSKYGHGKAYGLVMDLTSGAVDLASDALLTAATGGASIGGKLAITAGLGAMGARSFGAGAQEAEQEGKSIGQQFVTGLKSATIEMLTEKIGGPFEGAYGKALMHGLPEKLAEKLAGNVGAYYALNALKNFTDEGVEEMLSDVLNPLADKILKLDNGEGLEELLSKEGLSQMAYDGLVGGILGLLGSATEVGKTEAERKAYLAERESAISDGIDSAMAASQQGRSIGAELEADKDGIVAKAISNQAPQTAAEAQSAIDQQITPKTTEVSENAPPVEFNSKPEGETKPIGKKTAERMAGAAYLADAAKQRAKNADQAGVGVDAEGWEDTNINPALWNDRKTVERALAQNGVDYKYDPRETLWDNETGQYREVDLDILNEEERNQLLADMKQARLLDAVDNWLDKNYRKIINSKKPNYTVANARVEFQSKLSDFVRWYLANDVDNGRFALGLDEADNREKHSRAKEAGETLREIAEDKAAEARLKGKKRTKTHSKNGFDVTAIGEATYRVIGPGGRESVQVANGIDEAIQKHADEGSEFAKKAAEQRKTKEAELKKMRKDVIESGKNPAQVDGSDGNSYEVTKQFSNEQQTRYEYVVTELDEDGLPTDREARVFQNRANTNEEAVQYAIDNDLFKEDDYSDLTEGSNDEEQRSKSPERESLQSSSSRNQRGNDFADAESDAGGRGNRSQGESRKLVGSDADSLSDLPRVKVDEPFQKAIEKDFGEGAFATAIGGWHDKVCTFVSSITGHNSVWVAAGLNPQASANHFNGNIGFSIGSDKNATPTRALASAHHEVGHYAFWHNPDVKPQAFCDAVYKKAKVSGELQKAYSLKIGTTYLFSDELLEHTASSIDLDSVTEYVLKNDEKFASLVAEEVAVRMLNGEASAFFEAKGVKDAQKIQKAAQEKADGAGLLSSDITSLFPTFEELKADYASPSDKTESFKRWADIDKFIAEHKSTLALAKSLDEVKAATSNMQDEREPVIADNAKEYAYQKKLEAEQNSDEAKEQAQSDEEKSKSTFGKNYEKVQKSAEDFAQIKTFADEDVFMQSDKKRDRAVKNKLKSLREAFSNAAKTGDVESLFKEYEKLNGDSDLGNFYNEQVQEEIDNWRKLVDEKSDAYNEPASTYAAARTMQMMAHKFKLANEYQQTLKKMNETLSGSKSGMLRKIAKSEKLTSSVARALVRWQINPDTVFKMVDAFDKGNMGEGYKLAKELQTAHREKYKVMQQQRARFSDLDSKYGKDYDDFWRGKQTVKDYSGREWDMRSALSVVKAIDTIRSTSGKKLGGTDGFGVLDSKGNIEYIEMSDVDALKLYESLKSGLSDVAIKYGDAAVEAFNDVKEPLRKKYKDNNGIEIRMVGDADENISENAKKKGIEKSVYSPLSYVTKNGQVYQFDIAKQDTYNNVPRFLRERSDEGGTYILIKPYTDVVDGYFEQVSNYLAYSSYGEKMRGLGKGSSYTPGLATSLADAFGKDMGNWYQNYVEDLKTYKNEEDTEGVNSLLRQGRQKLQQGALLFSVSVPMKQISSYWAASGILHPDSLIKNYRAKLLKPKNSSDAATMLASRAMGNLEQSASEAAKDAEKWLGKLKYSSKFIKFAADAINQMDYNTVSNLLSATEYDVLKYQFNNDKSKVGTEEYKAAVEELFQEVVDRSQPNFDKQMRAEYGRTDNEIIRMLSMFRTQQTQNLNLLATAIGEYRAAKGTDNQAKATETLKQTIAGQAASAFSLSVLTILADMLLHRQKKYEDEDKQIDPTKVLSRLGINAIEASSGTLWFGDTVAKWAIDQLSGGETNEFYGLNLGVVTTLSNAIDAIGSVIQTPTRSNVKYAAGQIATMFGIPLNNAYAFLNSAIMYAKDVAGTNEGDYDDILKYLDAQAKAAKKEEEKAAKQAAKEAQKSGADVLAEAASRKPSQTELNAQEEQKSSAPSGYLRKPYNALMEAGMSSERSDEVLGQMDADSNNSIKQSEMIAYWKAHPEDEQYVMAMWNSYGYKTSWEQAKKKAG